MATAGYSAMTSARSSRPTAQRASKRKLSPTLLPSASRRSPMSRRNNQYQDPTASMDETGEEGFTAAQFNLTNLAPDSNREEETANVNTAAAALNYSMQVPVFGADGTITHETVGQGEQNNYNNIGEDNAEDVEGGQGADQTGGDFEDSPTNGDREKPAVGSEEWTRLRKDNHKEVERRRRETINEGINELAKIVPNCEKNKGSILARAVQYINQLRDEASQNIDKWTFEKLVTEQALNDLSSKLQRAWAEKEAWIKLAKEAGVDVDNVDLGLEPEDKDDEVDVGERRNGKKRGKDATSD